MSRGTARAASVPRLGGVPFLGSYHAYRRDPLAFYRHLGRQGDLCHYRMLGFSSVR